MKKRLRFLETLTERQCLLLLLGVTFGLRLYAVLMAQGIAYDGAAYGFMARDFLRGDYVKGLSAALHPLYPLLISLVSFDPAHVEIAGRFISLFFGTLALFPVFYLSREAAGQKASVFSGLFYAFHPYLVTYSGMLLSEATYWGLLLLSIHFFWTGLKKEKAWRIALSGVFLGLVYLTRPEGIGYVFIYLIWIVVEGILRKKWFRKIIISAVLMLSVFIVVMPYVAYIHRETGQWLISKKGVSVQSQVLGWVKEKKDRPSGQGRERKEAAHPTRIGGISSKILQNLENVVRYIPFTTYYYLRAYHFTLWLFLFFGWMGMKRNRAKGQWFLMSFVLFHLLSLSTFTHSTIRFSVPLVPISLFWAGAGVSEVEQYLQKMRIHNPWKWVSFLMILALLIQLPQDLTPERRHRADQKRVGLWLKENTPKDATLMSNSPIEAFYGERGFILFPLGLYTFGTPGRSYKEIIQYAREKGVKYISINKYTHELNPGFEESIQSADLKEIYRFKEKDGNLIIVYEVIY